MEINQSDETKKENEREMRVSIYFSHTRAGKANINRHERKKCKHNLFQERKIKAQEDTTAAKNNNGSE